MGRHIRHYVDIQAAFGTGTLTEGQGGAAGKAVLKGGHALPPGMQRGRQALQGALPPMGACQALLWQLTMVDLLPMVLLASSLDLPDTELALHLSQVHCQY